MTPETRKLEAPTTEQCPRCWGRGYQPQERKASGRNPHGLGFYARTCARCGGSGAIPTKQP